MWFCKKREEPKHDMTAGSCDTCGCLVAMGRGKTVTGPRWDGWLNRDESHFYCDLCAPPYGKTSIDSVGGRHYYNREPAHEVEVTEKGKAVGPR